MATIVVPYRGENGKRRLDSPQRSQLSRAMLEDVVAAASGVGRTIVVTPADVDDLPVDVVADPCRGQGAAVAAALDEVLEGPVLIVNADVPCVTARDLLTLLGAAPADGLALVSATDGTTNALALARPELFEPLYGPGSAERFRALAPSRVLEIPNLVDDVDTLDDVLRLGDRLGAHTQAALGLGVGAASRLRQLAGGLRPPASASVARSADR